MGYYQQKWYRENKEYKKAYFHEWYRKNRERHLQKCREYKEMYRDEIRIRRKKERTKKA